MSSDKPKIGLGRGLGALIGPAAGAPMTFKSAQPESEPVVEERPPSSFSSSSDEAPSSSTLRMIDPQQIRVNVEQPRTVFADDALDELAESIREHGILQPLVVTETAPGEYELIAGERRLRASLRSWV